ncbi:amino acid synthesis family protein [Rhodococcus koreensis]
MRIRKIVTFAEETRIEGFKETETPLVLASAMAVIENPFAGKYVENLFPLVEEYSESLGELLSERAVACLPGGAETVEVFGKGGLVGTDGEIEHSAAIIHTLRFGTPIRERVQAKNLLVGCDKRGAAGSTLDIPLIHVREDKARGHYISHEVRIPDAPRPNEIVIVFTAGNGSRPHPRSGSFGNELTA